MPEEINRLVTDRLADLLLTPDKLSVQNLLNEGVHEKNIQFVGNIMIDTLEANRDKAAQLSIDKIIQDHLIPDQSLSPSITRSLRPSVSQSLRLPVTPSLSHSVSSSPSPSFALMTLHRPSNVNDPTIFTNIINLLTEELSREIPIFWPIHPRSKKQLKNFDLWDQVLQCENLVLLHPIGYHEMLRMNMDARIMLTDSGGLQEECTVLGTPCLTLRWNTERPITLREHGGASVLVGNNIVRIREEFHDTLQQDRKPERPELWDGKTAGRCLKAILEYEEVTR
jgi:UDP-N-acetylglucosamine 2-epimerase (non-hydrolysing)